MKYLGSILVLRLCLSGSLDDIFGLQLKLYVPLRVVSYSCLCHGFRNPSTGSLPCLDFRILSASQFSLSVVHILVFFLIIISSRFI